MPPESAIPNSGGPARREMALIARALGRGALNFYNSADLTYASSIAYYALLSLFPFLLIAFSILGSVTADAADRSAVLNFVLTYFPRQLDFVSAQLDALTQSRVQLGVVGTLVIIWAAMGVFGAVTSGVNHAWRVEQRPSFFKHKVVSFLMLAAAGLLLLVALILVSAIQVARASWFAEILARAPGLLVLRSLAVRSASPLLFILVVGLIFYFVTNAKVHFRDVWVGAVVTGALWQGVWTLFSWYVRDLSRYRLIHGSIAAVVVFLIWVYLSAAIFLLGAEISAAYARLRAKAHAGRSGGPDSRRP